MFPFIVPYFWNSSHNYPEFPFSFGGTAQVILYRKTYLLLTARHCLSNRINDLDKLFVINKNKDLISPRRVIIPDENVCPGLENDLAVLIISGAHHLNSFNLSDGCTTSVCTDISRGDEVCALGYPNRKNETLIDYENNLLSTKCSMRIGNVVGPNANHKEIIDAHMTDAFKFDSGFCTGDWDWDRMSGGAVIRRNNDFTHQYCGMSIMAAGNKLSFLSGVAILHFLDSYLLSDN